MGANYTRQSTYTDGDTISAADTNDEFDQLLAAFAANTGHTHDGTTGEGGPITTLATNTVTFSDWDEESVDKLCSCTSVTSKAKQCFKITLVGKLALLPDKKSKNRGLRFSSLFDGQLQTPNTASVDLCTFRSETTSRRSF